MSEVDGALHVLDRGTGSPTLLFVNGFASSSRLWSEVIDRLEEFHRCVAPDLSGFGRSPVAGPDRRIEDQARELRHSSGPCIQALNDLLPSAKARISAINSSDEDGL